MINTPLLFFGSALIDETFNAPGKVAHHQDNAGTPNSWHGARMPRGHRVVCAVSHGCALFQIVRFFLQQRLEEARLPQKANALTGR
jgi:hypothetical protein